MKWSKNPTFRRSVKWTAAIALVLAALVAANYALDWIAAMPGVRLQRVVLKGDMKRIDRVQLNETLRRVARGGFFTVKVQEVRAQVERLPWVRTAAVRRVWPDRLEVTLEEHVPRARWGATQLLNSFDEVFRADYSGELPRLSGPPGTEKLVAAWYRNFAAALQTIGQEPADTSLSARHAWQVRLKSGLTLALGREQMAERMQRFVAVSSADTELTARSGTIDLRYPNGFAVKFTASKAGEEISSQPKRGNRAPAPTGITGRR